MREMNPRVRAGLVPLQWGFTRGNGARAHCGARFMADLPRVRNAERDRENTGVHFSDACIHGFGFGLSLCGGNGNGCMDAWQFAAARADEVQTFICRPLARAAFTDR